MRFAGSEIHSDDDFFGAVCTAESPAALSVKRPGEEKPLELTVDLWGSPLRWGIMWRVDDAEPGAVILTYVVPGSPAARAGLSAGDRIYQVGGRDFADEAAFAEQAKTLPLPIELLVERDGRLRRVLLQVPQAEPVQAGRVRQCEASRPNRKKRSCRRGKPPPFQVPGSVRNGACMTEASPTAHKPPPAWQMSACMEILNDIQEQIRFADSKAGFIAAFNVLLFGFIANHMDKLRTLWEGKQPALLLWCSRWCSWRSMSLRW